MGAGPVEWVTGAVALLAVTAYVMAAARLRRRGDAWPWPRDVSFAAGGAALAWAMPATLPGGPFTAHMAQHLITAMAAPLLLVLARPLVLALRILQPGRARRGLIAAARSRPAWLVFPPLTGLLDIGGLWVLYRTPLFADTHHQALLHSAVHLHILASGLLFTFALCQLDVVRHRWSLAWRGTTLLVVGAAHGVLAKTLYATPPPGTAYTATDVHTGAQLMYYGGDLIELALASVLAVQWHVNSGRTHARLRRVAARRVHPRGLPTRS